MLKTWMNHVISLSLGSSYKVVSNYERIVSVPVKKSQPWPGFDAKGAEDAMWNRRVHRMLRDEGGV